MGFIVNHCNNMAVTTPDSIKFTYFDLRVKGEAARLLLAYGGLEYEDDRVTLPWDDITQWKTLKPSMPYGQLPCLTWNGEKICQSMAICRFLAREMNIAGRNSVEMAQVDEIIDAVQDAIDANYKAWYSAKRKEELVMLTGKTFPSAMSHLERMLSKRGGQYMVGNNFTWADLHLFYFCSEDFLEPEIVQTYPKISSLVRRVGQIPNIENWMQTRPQNRKPTEGHTIYFKNAYKILKENLA